MTGMPRQKESPTSFGAKLIELRNASGMTQSDLALAVGITQRVISYYEAQGGSPDPEIIAKIAVALHTTTDELLGMSHKQPSSMKKINQSLYKKMILLQKLPAKEQKVVSSLISSLAEAKGIA